MAKNSIRDYDATSGNNTDVQSVDISEGCAASGINNALREIMTDLKNVSTGAVALETPGADQLNVDNLRLDGNTISSIDTNGNVNIDPNGTGVTAIAGGFTATDGCTITTTGSEELNLELISTNADANKGPVISFHRNSSSPANSDTLAELNFNGENDASEKIDYVDMFATSHNVADGSEEGGLTIRSRVGGSLRSRMNMYGSTTKFNDDGQDIDFIVEGSSIANLLKVDAGNNHVQLGNAAVQYRSDTNGLHIGKDTENANTVGTSITASGFMTICRNAATVMSVARNGDDGGLINFIQGGNLEGGISVSGSTVSFTGGHLSRWSQLADNTKDTSILKGTVMTNLDKMAVWHHEAQAATYYTEDDELPDGVSVGDEKTPAVDAYDEDNEQLNCMAVSSVEGDANVAGVFVNWDNDDDDFNDMNIAMTGDMVIRIASGTTVARGDLLMSAGDGTAKPQDDDIVRSKTIAKVTSTTVSHTYDDGTYLVPCVLMAC